MKSSTIRPFLASSAILAASTILFACSTAGAGARVPTETGSGLFVSAALASPAPGGPGATLIGLSFTAVGAQQAFLAAESSYTGAITATNSCAGIATISPSSGTGPAAVFTVTAVAAGNCQVTVQDTKAHSAAVLVTVTTTTGGIQ